MTQTGVIMKILIDGDILAYVCSSAVQKDIDWGDGLWTCHAYLDDAVVYFHQLLGSIKDALGVNQFYQVNWDECDVIFCFSDAVNFRKTLNPNYKAQRVSHRKPTCYKGLVDYIHDNYKCASYPTLEGDDVISILATCKKGDSIIISGDKDFKTVPETFFFNFMKNTFVYYHAEEAYRNLMKQVLTGDTADNYKGCPSVGAKTAEKIISEEINTKYLWDVVVDTYKKKGSTEEEAILNFNMAYLLHAVDDKTHKELPVTSFEYFTEISHTDSGITFNHT